MNITAAIGKPFHKGFLFYLLCAVAWLCLVFQVTKYVILVPLPSTDAFAGVDYPKHRDAAIHLLQGICPQEKEYMGFNYPTFAALPFLFLAWMTPVHAAVTWTVLMRAFTVAAIGLTLFGMRPRALSQQTFVGLPQAFFEHWHAVMAMIMALFFPAYLELHVGNIQPFIFFLIACFCVLLLHGWEKTAGIILAALCLIKITPIFFLPALFFSRKYRTCLYWAGTMGMYLLLLLVTGWWRWDLYLVREILPNVAYYWHGISSSLPSLIARLFPALVSNPTTYGWVTKSLGVGTLSLLLVFLWCGKIRAKGDRLFWRDALAFASSSMVIASPLLEYHHFTCLLPAWVFWWLDMAEGRQRKIYSAITACFWFGVLEGKNELIHLGNIPSVYLSPISLLGVWLAQAIRIVWQRREADYNITTMDGEKECL